MTPPSRRVIPAVVLALVAIAPLALAQKPPKKKKGAPPPTADAPPPDPAPPPPPPRDPTPPAEPAPAAVSATADVKVAEIPDTGEGSSGDVTEKPGKSYTFIGLRYRGNIVPQFITSLFVDKGGTYFTNSIGIEADLRKDHFSLIPALTYAEYGTGGGVLFLQKGKDAGDPGNWSLVNSDLKAVYLTADLLWSIRVHKNFDFEYGAGFGLGAIFGDLGNNWVTTQAIAGQQAYTPNGGGQKYYPCQTLNDGQGCALANHQNASPPGKVGGYKEANWFNGGAVPVVFPWISIPQFSLRFKPVKQMEARLSIGMSLTGFWFGLSANYGLEKPEKK